MYLFVMPSNKLSGAYKIGYTQFSVVTQMKAEIEKQFLNEKLQTLKTTLQMSMRGDLCY